MEALRTLHNEPPNLGMYIRIGGKWRVIVSINDLGTMEARPLRWYKWPQYWWRALVG